MRRECELARKWASAELDGELSAFEQVLLEDHTSSCAACAEFRTATGGMTDLLRAAPLEPFEARLHVRRPSRRVRFRLAPAVAAMAVAAVGLGSILSLTEVQPMSQVGSPVPVAPQFQGPSVRRGPVNLTVLRAYWQHLKQRVPAVDTSKTRRLARGGVVLK